jgi:hypothetical protein
MLAAEHTEVATRKTPCVHSFDFKDVMGARFSAMLDLPVALKTFGFFAHH